MGGQAEKKSRYLVVIGASADGEGVVCVRGVGSAARVCTDEKTRRLLVLEWFETT